MGRACFTLPTPFELPHPVAGFCPRSRHHPETGILLPSKGHAPNPFGQPTQHQILSKFDGAVDTNFVDRNRSAYLIRNHYQVITGRALIKWDVNQTFWCQIASGFIAVNTPWVDVLQECGLHRVVDIVQHQTSDSFQTDDGEVALIYFQSNHGFGFRAVVIAMVASAVALGSSPAAACAADARASDAPTDALVASSRPISLAADGSIGGEGADWLVRRASAARFVLVGENHGVAEVPRITAGWFRRLTSLGFDHLAIETGTRTASKLEFLVRRDLDREEEDSGELEAFLGAYPGSIPFYGLREEAELLATVAAATAPGAFWGVDQEFILAPCFLLSELRVDGLDSRAAAIVDGWIEAEIAAHERLRSGGPRALYMVSRDDFEVEIVRAALGSLESEAADRARSVLEEIETSRAIYRHNFTGRVYENNRSRAEHAKRLFLEAYRRASKDKPGGAEPRVVVKMGSNHCGRGRNPLGVLDLGNLVSQLAVIEGTESFHLAIVAGGGRQNLWVPMRDEEAKSSPIRLPPGVEPFLVAARAATAASDAGASGDETERLAADTVPGMRIFDLRALRPEASTWADPGSAEYRWIFEYDGLLLIPEGSASRTIGGA